MATAPKTLARLVVGDLTIYAYSYGVTIRDVRKRRLVTYMDGRVMDRPLRERKSER